MGTKGGNGDEVTYLVQENRGELSYATYNQVQSKIYLPIAHILDKQFQQPLAVCKGLVPQGVGVDNKEEIDFTTATTTFDHTSEVMWSAML